MTCPNQTTPHDIEPWAEHLAELRAEPDCDPSGQMADEAADRYEREMDRRWVA
ncbi:hypothetical protein [Nocardioides kribbensis]|uniref:CopG family transcriptional regulator n=1 Tax=Nocardioides kribbensis TaxID=305517 RepID=A0ABV1NZ12_9ACTN